MEEEYGICPSNDVLLGDVNAKIGKEDVYRGLIRKHSLHVDSNYDGQRLVDFAAAKYMVISSTR